MHYKMSSANLPCISNGDAAVLHLAIDFVCMIYGFLSMSGMWIGVYLVGYRYAFEECCAWSRYQGQGQVFTLLFICDVITDFWSRIGTEPTLGGLILDELIYRHMTSPNGNIFRVTGPLCGEFTGPRWIPHTKASDADLWCFLWSVSE